MAYGAGLEARLSGDALVSSTLTSSASSTRGVRLVAYGAGFETRLSGDALVSSTLTPSAQ